MFPDIVISSFFIHGGFVAGFLGQSRGLKLVVLLCSQDIRKMKGGGAYWILFLYEQY